MRARWSSLILALGVLCLLVGPACAEEAPRAGELWRDPETGMEFVWAPGGALAPTSGPASRDPYYGDDPDRLPRVKGFWIGKYEVTQGQWLRIMGANPAAFQKGPDYPVERVSLSDVREFIARLNAKGQAKFRLPSWREWEMAARAPYLAKYAGGNAANPVAWSKSNSRGATHPVGKKKPNELGLYDMSGNVSEWCGPDLQNESGAPRAPDSEPSQAKSAAPARDALFGSYRGGSWSDPPQDLSTGAIGLDQPDFKRNTIGFRLVRSQ